MNIKRFLSKGGWIQANCYSVIDHHRFRIFPSLLCVCAGAIGSFSNVGAETAGAGANARPNIVLIMSDDMGYSDLGCYGGEINTPNLDKLANGGLRYTQFYNGARCCPTRASLLTGLYPHMAGVGHMGDKHGPQFPGYTGSLNQECRTIAEVLRGAGYGTYMVGKWHVAHPDTRNSPNDNWPMQRGFDQFYGTITGAGSFYDPASLCRGNKFITPENDPEYRPKSFYYTDALTDNAINYLRRHQAESAGRPFFLYVSYTAAHWPLHAKPEDIVRYRGKYHAGYDAIRQARIEKMTKLGLIDPRWKPSATVGDWQKVEHPSWEERCMEVYAAMVDCMDQNIGRLIDQLDSQGQLDNTLILFLQDNGACAEPMGRSASMLPDDPQPMGSDDLQTMIWPPMQTRDGRPVRSGPEVMPGPADTYVGYGESWANVSATPFRLYKHWVHEGGISTPLIVHWPRGVESRLRNTLVKDPGNLVDIMATCVDVAGAKYPVVADSGKIHPLSGISLRPTFTAMPLVRPEPIFWEHEGNRAVRDGKWKLVSKSPTGPWELYDMDADRTEMYDLSGRESERVSAMTAQWEKWARTHRVLPWISTPPYGEAGQE